MMPINSLTRRELHATLVLLFGGLLLCGGCNALSLRSQSPEDDENEALISGVRLIGDMAVPFGMNSITVEAVSLVTNLPNTGSDPAPSTQRAAMLAEMQTRGVVKPNEVLASPTTELVMVRGYLRPGIQKGDKFDIEIRVPARSECQSLRGGFMLDTQLREMAVLESGLHKGKAMATAQGPVLVDPSASPTDRVKQGRARILGGGISQVSRELGLVIKTDDRNVLMSAQAGESINRRFHTFHGGLKQGVAKPKTDEFIELKVHPRYHDNIERYIRVVRSIPLRETPAQQLARVALLERQLLDPITASTAAVRLEALGKDGIETLKKGLKSEDEEVRFYSAEALAYLDVSDAAEVLGDLARSVPAFRAYALAALSAMDDYAAFESLRGLLSVPSAETRYGAFRSLWAMNSNEPLVRGENMKDAFSYHVLDVEGAPMIHVSRSHRPEIVVFGHDQKLRTPLALEAGQQIMITALENDTRVTVSRFAVGEPDQKRVVSNKVDDVVRAIVELGGTYPDVVEALQQAKVEGALAGRFEIDSMPQGGRTYVRAGETKEETEGDLAEQRAERPGFVVANPIPDLFAKRASAADDRAADRKVKKAEMAAETEEKPSTAKAFFDRMMGRGD